MASTNAPLLPLKGRDEAHLPMDARPYIRREWTIAVHQEDVGGASVAQSTFNLTKNLVGSGMLSLSYSMAAGTGIIPGILIIVFLGVYSGIQFALLGRLCEAVGNHSFHGLGQQTRGDGFAKLLDLVCTFKTLFGCLSFSIVVTDSFGGILHGFGAPAAVCDRTVVLVFMTYVILLPLCLLRDLSKLSFTSLLGCAGILYITVFMVFRYFDGTYAPGGLYYKTLEPSLRMVEGDQVNLWSVNISALVLVCTLSTAFVAHYNAPKFFHQLQARSSTRFNAISAMSFVIAIVFFIIGMVVGYLTFGSNSQGLILNNYSTSDPLATAARVALGGSVVCTYPLLFTGFRDGMMALCGLQVEGLKFNIATVILLTGVTVVVYFVKNVAFVVNLGGAIFGTAIIFTCPALIFVFYGKAAEEGVVTPHGVGGGPEVRERRQHPAKLKRYIFEKGTIVFGCVLAVLGSVVAILKEFAPNFLASD